MARLIVENAGLGVSIQDGGRLGFRKLGVPVSGALDQSFRIAANILAGAPEEGATLEILLSAPALLVEQGPLRLGFAGALSGVLNEDAPIRSWRGLLLQTGDRLALKLLRPPAYIAFSGGLDAPLRLGSRSVYARVGLGGALADGDVLSCADAQGEDFSASALVAGEGPLRFIQGPQADHFSPETFDAFTAARWTARPESDRMGLRLAGPRLVHAGAANIVSDGVTPGAIQIPGDGQPILLRADGQTSGGYAKIGCVVTADLDRIGHVLPGEAVSFRAVGHAEAARARAERRDALARWRRALTPIAGFDEDKLWSENLIGGAILAD
jgi:5-oxoprolinase (ATP-hydrolysing) subunit C